jgi:hypothetical protein
MNPKRITPPRSFLGDQSPRPPGILRFESLPKGLLLFRHEGMPRNATTPRHGGPHPGVSFSVATLGRRSGCVPAEPYPPPRPAQYSEKTLN